MIKNWGVENSLYNTSILLGVKLREFIILPKKSHKQFVFRRMQNVTVIITMLKFFPLKGMEHGCFLQKKLYFYGGKIFKYEFFTRNCSKCKIKIFIRSGKCFYN